jgi:GNAT superfamily N-acetyltransferase
MHADGETMNRTSLHPAIRPLLSSDIPAAMTLIREVGWNQLPADWERLLALEPQGCFALECSGCLAATTTAVCYDTELAWIGMVLTLPEFRRRGFAELLMHRALEFVEQRGIPTVKLDATEIGINLYRRLGFAEECAVERWRRPPGPLAALALPPYHPDTDYDREKFGANRTALLAQLAPLGSASLPGQGYAMGRPGSLAAYFGPCVANSPDAARTLLHWFLAQHPQEDVFWDLLPGNQEAVRLAKEFGFVPVRHLVRMVRSNGAAPPLSNHTELFAIAGFEFG